jgi:hypothetical protein
MTLLQVREMAETKISGKTKNTYVGYLEREECYVNLAGDYSYMSLGYYESQDLECDGKIVHPTCKETLDAYVAALFLEKARLAGLSIPTWYISNDYFEPPVIVDTINPFMYRRSVVMKTGQQDSIAKSLTRNYTYAICCQSLPEGSRLGKFRMILGWSASPRYREAAASIWQVFRIPLAEMSVVITKDDGLLFSSLDPLPYEKLTAREKSRIDRDVTWQT